MGDGIQWLRGGNTGTAWMVSVVFARGIDPEELALRMGAPRGAVTEPITDAEVLDLDLDFYRPLTHGDAVARVGEHAGWSFAIEYGHAVGVSRLAEVSRDGVEAFHYDRNPEHPPTIVFYARDGQKVCGFGLGEEPIRWGKEPDLLLPDLVAAGILNPDGDTYPADPDEDEDESVDYAARDRRALAVVEERFSLSLPRTVFTEDRLPAYVTNSTPAPDFEAIHDWAATNGRPLPDARLGLIPATLRRNYEHATDPRWHKRQR
ncbi:hypothetical protein [Streptomyces sp. NBRC 110028]|uniref:DUF6461 domain-containing protein n=1 Tax=Streptomyces sp. NBRC 110028 TaxID=1621260 RepID=UPI0006E3C7BA|nr:hypothetical protein [Streptomyces sp. NBRC 110028]